MLGLTSKIAEDSLNFMYDDKINPNSPGYKELQDLMEDHKYLKKRMINIENSYKAGDIYRNETQYLEAKNKVQESINKVLYRMQQITGDAKSITVKGYKYDADPKNKPEPKADIDTTSRIVPRGTPGSVLAMRGGDLPNPFYYQGGGPKVPDAIVAISEGSEKANIAKVVELHKNWLETGAVPDGLSDDQIKRLAEMREKQLNIIDNLPDDYKLGYYRPDATTSHAITLDNFIQERKQGGTSITPSPTKMIEVEGDFDRNADAYRARTSTTGGTVGDITFDFVNQATYDRGAGSGATKKSTQSGGNPYQPVLVNNDGTIKGGQIDGIAQIIADHLTTGKTVNIAGHGAYQSPRTGFNKPMDQEIFNNELNKVFDKVLEIIGDKPITGKVITGGQSGYDLAGSRAAASHGIPNEAYYSSTQAEGGALFRTPEGEDIDNLEEFRKRFNRFGPGGMPPIDTPEFATWYEKEIESKSSTEIIDDVAKNSDVESSLLRKAMGEVPGFLVVPLEAAVEVGLRYGRIAKANPRLAKNARRFIMYELAMFAAAVVTGVVTYNAYKFRGETGYSSADLYTPYSYKGTDEANQKMEEFVNYSAEVQEIYEQYPELKERVEENAKEFAMAKASENMDFFIKKMPTYYIDELLFEYVPALKEARDEYADKKFFSEGGWRAALAQPQLAELAVEGIINAMIEGGKRMNTSYGR